MVMEVSPQCVGLEFVRQYYTVLNKAPQHLHRFYSHNSSFMHGGTGQSMSDPAIGQEDIHKKISSLNFRDCHAKIRMVDAHATLANGVVIQVTGELSNNGLPMRRFMQSFVLAPQTPKKYYVHNDIFRYQDEVFNDNEIGEEGGSELEEELECPVTSDTSYSSTPQTTTLNGTAHPEPDSSTPPAPSHMVVGPTAGVTPSSATVQTSLSPTPATPIPAEPAPSTSPPPTETGPRWSGPEAEGWGSVVMSDGETWDEAVSSPQSEKLPNPDPPQSEPQSQPSVPSSHEPKTFANLFKASSGTYTSQLHGSPLPQSHSQSITSQAPPPPQSNSLQSPPPPQPSAQLTSPPSSVPQQQTRLESGSRMSNSSATSSTLSQGPGSYIKPQRNNQNRPNNRERPYRPSIDDNVDLGERMHWSSRSNESLDDRRRSQASDSQQIFVGNLPHILGEDELRNEFSRFGKIIEIRINTTKGKTGMKGPGGHQVPNFGFITFDDETAVAKCLDSRPIMLNNDHRLNVEEKKARRAEGSSGGGLGRPSSGRGGMGSSMRGGGPMGGPQGRSGPRGGSGVFNRGGSGGSRGGYNQRR